MTRSNGSSRRAGVGVLLAAVISIGLAACTTPGSGGPPAPRRVPITGANAVAAGTAHTCAIVVDGKVKCWGQGFYGQVGDGFNNVQVFTAVDVSAVVGATAITAGARHTCALVAGGTVKCWGGNEFGQLGNGADLNEWTAVDVSGVADATAIAAGDSHTCAVVAGGAVKCWGRNFEGQLGDGTNSAGSTTAVDVSGVADATAIAAGTSHTCAVVAGGAVKCWGYNSDGQLGDGTIASSNTPVDVSGVVGATTIAAGKTHTCAVVAGGAVKCWGNNHDGQLGDGTDTDSLTAVDVTGVADASAIAAGDYHTCAAVAGDAVKCWGYNGHGELGNGTPTLDPTSTPVDVTGVADGTDVAAGWGHSCAVVAGGAVKCWGWNSSGELANGTSWSSSTAVDALTWVT